MKYSFDARLKHGMRVCVFMAGIVMMGAVNFGYAQQQNQVAPAAYASIGDLGRRLAVGDVVFIRIPLQPFIKVSETTSSWTNHVGIVTDVSGAEPVIAESRVPLSGETTWSNFVKRSEAGRVAVARLGVSLNERQQDKLRKAAATRLGILYDTGFDLHSHRQFCSRFVREVLGEATGVQLGEVENFATLLRHNPQADQSFWRVWYFGSIPWQRETVTPASLLRDDRLNVYFDGHAKTTYSDSRADRVQIDTKGERQ